MKSQNHQFCNSAHFVMFLECATQKNPTLNPAFAMATTPLEPKGLKWSRKKTKEFVSHGAEASVKLAVTVTFVTCVLQRYTELVKKQE